MDTSISYSASVFIFISWFFFYVAFLLLTNIIISRINEIEKKSLISDMFPFPFFNIYFYIFNISQNNI